MIDPVLRDRMVQRSQQLGIAIPEYVRYCIIKDLELTKP